MVRFFDSGYIYSGETKMWKTWGWTTPSAGNCSVDNAGRHIDYGKL